MIIVRLIGGLGNQLFQYATARHLSVMHNTELKLDIRAFEGYRLRKYSLAAFNIKEVFASHDEILSLASKEKKGVSKYLFRVTKLLQHPRSRTVFREHRVSPYNASILKTSSNLYLDGYWQSEKYFVDVKDIILSEFTLQAKPSHLSLELASQISKTQSISLHIRRGDYISNSNTNKLHGTTSLDYYKQSANFFAQEIASPHFFVFSDDPDWVVKNLNLEFPTTFVTHNDALTNYEDLWLMSLCKHNIIANSSFSWWAAWLNSNPNKIVIAPEKWFNSSDIETKDLVPQEWLRI